MPTQLPILIIGAGLSGLSLALLLSHNSIPFILFETSPRNDPSQGYGITLRDWAYLPLLSALNHTSPSEIEDFKRYVAVDGPVGGIGRIEGHIVDVTNGEVLVELSNGEEGHVRANRGRIREWFLRGIEERGVGSVRWGCRVESVRRDGQGEGIAVEVEGGEEVRGWVVVAADGVNSSVRRAIAPHVQPEMTPAVVYNWQRTLPRAEFDRTFGRSFKSTNVLFGVGDEVLVGPSMVDLNETEARMSWTISKPADSSQEEHDVHAAIQKELKRVGQLAVPFDDLVGRERKEQDSFYRWQIRSLSFPREELDAAAREHGVLFIGDSGHSMPIFAGEGGNHALLDAVELAKLLQSGIEPAEVARSFYDGAYERWQKGISDSTKRFAGLHKPLEEWRAIAKMKGEDQKSRTATKS